MEQREFLGLMVEASKIWQRHNGEKAKEVEEDEDGLSDCDSEEDSWLDSEEEDEE